MTTRCSSAWGEYASSAHREAIIQKASNTIPVAPNTNHRNRNSRPPAENTRATMVAATIFTAPSAASATGSRDGGTGPTAAIGSNSRRQEEITNMDSTVAATIAAIILRGCVTENAEA